MSSLITDLHTLTSIPIASLDKLVEKSMWCICSDIEESILDKNNITKIEKILPAHLKANPIDITLHGEAMAGFDFKHSDWNFDKILFNVLQLGIPENKQPIIKI